MKQKTKKVIQLNPETILKLETKEAMARGEGTDASHPTCCP